MRNHQGGREYTDEVPGQGRVWVRGFQRVPGRYQSKHSPSPLTLQGQPNQRRQAIINKAYLKFDKNCDGFITAEDLVGVYDTSQHPKVKSGEMTEDEVFNEFLESFGDTNKDKKITVDEWNEYYAAVSSNVDNDQHFIQLMQTAWKID